MAVGGTGLTQEELREASLGHCCEVPFGLIQTQAQIHPWNLPSVLGFSLSLVLPVWLCRGCSRAAGGSSRSFENEEPSWLLGDGRSESNS